MRPWSVVIRDRDGQTEKRTAYSLGEIVQLVRTYRVEANMGVEVTPALSQDQRARVLAAIGDGA